MKKGIRGLFTLLIAVPFFVFSEVGTVTIDGKTYTGDIKKVPVTFYDFHSDRSNPEFEQPFDSKDHYLRGMVSTTLDSDGKPTVGSNPFRNNYIKYWFREYDGAGGAKGDSTIPNYIYDDFKNTVIQDSTPNFKWVTSNWGTYTNAITNLKTNNGKSATWPYKKHYYNYSIPGTTPSEFDFFLEWYADVKMDGTTKLSHDTSFINQKFVDTLLFIDTAYNTNQRGKYFYVNDNFYPLDGKGFGNEWNVHDAQYIQKGNEWSVPVSYLTQPDNDYNNVNNGYNQISFKKVTVDGIVYFIDLDFGDTMGLQLSEDALDHNYGFTMEMDYKFTMDDGLKFSFSGDDDLWVYINGRLVLDLGGIHSPATDSFDVDKLNDSLSLGLVKGQKYSLQAFYAERHSDSSHILITTNIVPVPGEVDINLHPNNAIVKAGEDELKASLSITDKDGTPISNDNITSVTWDWGTTPNDGFFTKIGESGKEDSLIFSKPHEAYDTILVQVSVLYIDPDAGTIIPEPVVNQVTIVVAPGSYHHLSLEEDYVIPTDKNLLRNDNPIDEIKLLPGVSNASVYAIMRDQFGNWIDPAPGLTNDDWKSMNTDLVTVSVGNASNGEGVITKVGVGGETTVEATYQNKSDDVKVIVAGVELEMESAIYIDNNADGYVDLIQVKMNDYTAKVFNDSSNIDMAIVMNAIFPYLDLPSDKNLKKISANPNSNGDGFDITVEADTSTFPNTSVNETDLLIQNQSVQNISDFAAIYKDTIPIADGLAPVIIKVIYDPNNDGHNKKKTLTVVFSEFIKKPDMNDLSDKLLFFDDNGATYKMILGKMDGVNNNDVDTSFIYEVVMINGKENPETGDSVKLDDNSNIEDTTGNVQDEETKPITIEVGDYENTVSIGVLGPFTPNDEIKNIENIKDFLNVTDKGDVIKDKGTLLIISIEGVVLDVDSTNWSVDLVIYDAVGNIVNDGLEAVLAKDDNGKWNIVANWDGKNKGGRAVGSGSYLAQAVVNYKNEPRLTESIIIAVKGSTK